VDYYERIASKLSSINGVELQFDESTYQWQSVDGNPVDVDGIYLGYRDARNFELEPLAYLMWINYGEPVVVDFDVDTFTGTISCGPVSRSFIKERDGVKHLPSFDRKTRARHGISHPYPCG